MLFRSEIDQAVAAVLDSLGNPLYLDEIHTTLREKYSIEAMVDGYESVISSPGKSRRRPKIEQSMLVLAPWCEIQDGRIWNDYTSEATESKELVLELRRRGSISTSDFDSSVIENAVERGDLIPEINI